MYKIDCSFSVSCLFKVLSLSVKYLVFITATIIIFSSNVYSQKLVDEGEIYRFTGSRGNEVVSNLVSIRISDFDSLNLCGYALKLLGSLNMKINSMGDKEWFGIDGVKWEKDLRSSVHLARYSDLFYIIVQESANDNTKFSETQAEKSKQRVKHLSKVIIYQIKDFL